VASIGPLVFIEESTYTYACGVHGIVARSFLVWDLDQNRSVDLVAALPKETVRAAIEAAEPLLADDTSDPVFGDARTITEVLPDFASPGGLAPGKPPRFMAQVTAGTCYACSDGRWSSYSRSVRVEIAPPPEILARHTAVPEAVVAFAARATTAKTTGETRGESPAFGGWSP
jgi:hypothetical protein